MGFFSKIASVLKKTKDNFSKKLSNLFKRSELNAEFYDELEEILITGDVGVQTSLEIIDQLKYEIKENKIKTVKEAQEVLESVICEMVDIGELELSYPCIITFVGVNGVGKTTTIGKLANYFKKQGKNVMLVAGDTYRAAASNQLIEWGNRAKVKVVSQGEGADPSAVVFDGISSAKAKGVDVLLVDTAGRLHNKENLMEELKKINRVKNKEWQEAEHLNFIVIDATTGQNAISQVEAFKDSVGIDGIVLTKLDGTAKGGAVIGIINELQVPIVYIGLGEGLDDIDQFDTNHFVQELLSSNSREDENGGED